MKLLFTVALVFSGVAFATAQNSKVWFGYFVKGDGKRGTDAEVQKMQQGHMENLQRLFKLGVMPMAGPLRDPTQIRRGIIVMLAPSRDGLAEYFKNDPYVQGRLMGVEFYPWSVDPGVLPKEYPDPNAIEQNRLVLLKAKPGKKIPEYLMKQHVAAVAGKVKPSLSGVAEMGPEYSEILMFHGENDKAIEARIQQDPLVRLGWVTVEKIPLWMAKGALKP